MGDGLEFGLIADKARRMTKSGRLSKKAQRLYKHMARTDGQVYEDRSSGRWRGDGVVQETTGRKIKKGFTFAFFLDLFS